MFYISYVFIEYLEYIVSKYEVARAQIYAKGTGNLIDEITFGILFAKALL